MCAMWTRWWLPCSALRLLQSVFGDLMFFTFLFPNCANSRHFSPSLLLCASTLITVSGSTHLMKSIAFNEVYWFRQNIGKVITVSDQACHQTSYYPGLRMWIIRAGSSGWFWQVVMIKHRAGVYLAQTGSLLQWSQRSWSFYMDEVCITSFIHGSHVL